MLKWMLESLKSFAVRTLKISYRNLLKEKTLSAIHYNAKSLKAKTIKRFYPFHRIRFGLMKWFLWAIVVRVRLCSHTKTWLSLPWLTNKEHFCVVDVLEWLKQQHLELGDSLFITFALKFIYFNFFCNAKVVSRDPHVTIPECEYLNK